MSEMNRISLTELFKENRQNRAAQEGRVVVKDGEVVSVPEIELNEFEEVLIQKDEGIIKVGERVNQRGVFDLKTITYDEYVRKSKEEELQQRIEIKNEYNRMEEIIDELFGDDYDVTGARDNFWGYNKLGVNSSGENYIMAILANQFEQLNTRKFLNEEELSKVVNARDKSVAVVNNNRSIKELVTFTVKRERGLRTNTIAIENNDGETIPYLQQKLDYIINMGVNPKHWVLYLKTRFEFEEDYRTLEELKDKEFNA